MGDISHFSFKSVKFLTKNIERLAFVVIRLHNSDADIKIKSRSEFHQPAVPRALDNIMLSIFLIFLRTGFIPNHTAHILSQILLIDKVTCKAKLIFHKR